MDLFILTSDLFIFVFWYQLWLSNSSDSFFNPYLIVMNRTGVKCLEFFHPIAPKLTKKQLSALIIIFLILLRGAIALNINAPWYLVIGQGGGLLSRMAAKPSMLDYTLFSTLSFALFVVKVWAIHLLVSLLNINARPNKATITLRQLAHPLSSMPLVRQFLFLWLSSMLIIIAVNRCGQLIPLTSSSEFYASTFEISWQSAMHGLLAVGALSIAFWGDVFMLFGRLTVMLMMLGFIATMLNNKQQQQVSRDFIEAFLGPARQLNARIGQVDLRPLILLISTFIVAGMFISMATNYIALLS